MKKSWKLIVEHRLESCSLSSRHCVVHSLSLKHSLKNHREKMTEQKHHPKNLHSTGQGYNTSKLLMYKVLDVLSSCNISYFPPLSFQTIFFKHFLFKFSSISLQHSFNLLFSLSQLPPLTYQHSQLAFCP